MSHPASILATPTAERSERKHKDRPLARWTLMLLVAAIACTVLVLDAAVTSEQRIALSVQLGMFP
jgi:hypothetical protein